ncbi:hypothetical protein OCU04_001023 [Sclerotinia nivalis]|uniref:Uncharacterized protein n=1 Tax=Sclerotinia nivalis TaxID=352851 RepID=A0A9X0DQT0_9HELO|nr:hypothetical protein OCU04_001023 [Sclerotinia nivalis]
MGSSGSTFPAPVSAFLTSIGKPLKKSIEFSPKIRYNYEFAMSTKRASPIKALVYKSDEDETDDNDNDEFFDEDFVQNVPSSKKKIRSNRERPERPVRTEMYSKTERRTFLSDQETPDHHQSGRKSQFDRESSRTYIALHRDSPSASYSDVRSPFASVEQIQSPVLLPKDVNFTLMSIFKIRRVRNLEYRSRDRIVKFTQYGKNHIANITAALIQERGVIAPVPCHSCDFSGKPGGPWTQCVTLPGFGDNACANCHVRYESKRCNFRGNNKSRGKSTSSRREKTSKKTSSRKRGRIESSEEETEEEESSSFSETPPESSFDTSEASDSLDDMEKKRAKLKKLKKLSKELEEELSNPKKIRKSKKRRRR